ncbi:hypothetical protein [Bacillus cereus]|uniref:hypothetical protein n=1 Tax=Bacillus cereus TaxID=1396 RepID=UPI003016BF0A
MLSKFFPNYPETLYFDIFFAAFITLLIINFLPESWRRTALKWGMWITLGISILFLGSFLVWRAALE